MKQIWMWGYMEYTMIDTVQRFVAPGVQTHLPSGPETSTWVRIQWRPPGNQINQTCLAGKSTIYSSWMILQVINLHLVWGFSSQKCLIATAEAKPDQQINVNCDQCIDKCVGEGYVRYLKLASTSSSIQQLFYSSFHLDCLCRTV